MAMVDVTHTELSQLTDYLLGENSCRMWPTGSPGYMAVHYVVGDPNGEHDVVAKYYMRYNPELEPGVEYNFQIDYSVIVKHGLLPQHLLVKYTKLHLQDENDEDSNRN